MCNVLLPLPSIDDPDALRFLFRVKVGDLLGCADHEMVFLAPQIQEVAGKLEIQSLSKFHPAKINIQFKIPML